MTRVGEENFQESTPDGFFIKNVAALRAESVMGGGTYMDTLASMLDTKPETLIGKFQTYDDDTKLLDVIQHGESRNMGSATMK